MNHKITLTEQQQAVVNHTYGPALVFAVAGAGKTTAMVYRIERLVREGIFRPERVLATSFGRSNVRDLRQALGLWPYCAAVDVRTLHSLGWDIIRRAQRHGYLAHLQLGQDEGRGSVGQRLLQQTLAEARRQNVPYKAELEGMDHEDFLSYVGYCKGNLLYADVAWAAVPEDSRHTVAQAVAPPAPLEWYLNLYQRHKQCYEN